jgi:hypothetical protein
MKMIFQEGVVLMTGDYIFLENLQGEKEILKKNGLWLLFHQQMLAIIIFSTEENDTTQFD